MLTQIRRFVFVALLILISFTLLRSRLRQRIQAHHKYAAQNAQEPEKVVTHHANASTFEHFGTLDEEWEGAPRLIQVSAQYGSKMDLLYERGLRSHVKYGEKWGYPTHYLRQDIIGKGDFGDGMFNKLLFLQTIMVTELIKPFGKRAEWLAWFDADSIHLNNEIPWTIFLPPNEGEMFRDINLLITKDWNGYNAGIFMIRVCEWSVNVLVDAIAIPRLRPEIDIPYRDQDAFRWVFEQAPNRRHRMFQPRHWWNNFDDIYFGGLGERVMNGTFQLHFPGMYGQRHDAMGKWLDRIDRHPEEFNIPLANTTYPQEIEAYWARLQSASQLLKLTEEYKAELKEKQYDVFQADQGRIPNRLGQAENELHEVIQEEPFDNKRVREAVLKLDSAVREAKKDAADASKRLEEEKRRKEEAEKQEKEDGEKQKKEGEEKKKKKKKKQKQKDVAAEKPKEGGAAGTGTGAEQDKKDPPANEANKDGAQTQQKKDAEPPKKEEDAAAPNASQDSGAAASADKSPSSVNANSEESAKQQSSSSSTSYTSQDKNDEKNRDTVKSDGEETSKPGPGPEGKVSGMQQEVKNPKLLQPQKSSSSSSS